MLHAVRAIFLLLSVGIGWFIGDHYDEPVQGALYGVAVAAAAILLENAFSRRFIGIMSVLLLGLLAGFVLSHLLISALYLIPVFRDAVFQEALSMEQRDPFIQIYVEFSITFFLTFLSVIAILHTKDEFKFVIPFVELKREGQVGRPMLLDTSVIIDGRIADVVDTRIIDTPIVVPRFVLQELQQVADSSDKVKRNRGRRGLDILHRMQKDKNARIEIQDVTLPAIEGVDAKLVKMASMINARIVTNDFNLNKVARVQGVEVINVNDLANAMRPQVLQGEPLTVKVLRQGESTGQGVGYLEDGTMVVAEGCADRIGQEVDLVVTNVLQTSAGRLIFGRPAQGPSGSK
ncbi:MAG: PIN domain-containing protein [Planctomycetota bacterium]|jgi:uncharacterized protein YacL